MTAAKQNAILHEFSLAVPVSMLAMWAEATATRRCVSCGAAPGTECTPPGYRPHRCRYDHLTPHTEESSSDQFELWRTPMPDVHSADEEFCDECECNHVIRTACFAEVDE